MPYLMKPYDDALKHILSHGIQKKDRTGVGCISVAGIQSKYRLDSDAFPIVTKRKMFPNAVWAELLWFISGSTYNQDLIKLGCKFWGKWCDETNPRYVEFRKKWGYRSGDFGPIYGWQLRYFGADYLRHTNLNNMLSYIKESNEHDTRRVEEIYEDEIDKNKKAGFDQLAYMIDILKNDPYGSNGRRCLFNLWNPKDLDKMALPPCHYTYQAIPDGDGGLTGILTQRSNDTPVGVPANIQFYSSLTIMLAQQCGLKAREFVHEMHDAHIYLDQVKEVEEYLSRKEIDSPTLEIKPAKDIYSYQMSDFVLTNYNPESAIKINVAV